VSEEREVTLGGCFPWLLLGLLFLAFSSMEDRLDRIASAIENAEQNKSPIR
jgi:hypothetical protein